MIDSILGELRFFALFEKEIRMKIYKLCTLLKVPPGQMIQENLLENDYMYVIMNGDANLNKKDFDFGIDVPLVSLKAGDCFGDLNI